MALTILDATLLTPPPTTPADPAPPPSAPDLAQLKAWADADRQALREAIPGHPAADSCTMPDCAICAARDCPHEEPLHYDKEGCPACAPAPATRPTGARSEPPGASLR